MGKVIKIKYYNLEEGLKNPRQNSMDQFKMKIYLAE